jgi:RNA recognition motif-containing protein
MKIYVGNLSYSTSEEDIRQAFSAFGAVDSADLIMDRGTGRSKGFGFVEMSVDSEGQAAIDALNGKDVDGRALKVSEAQPREDKPRGGGGFGGGGGGGRDRDRGRGGRDRF